MKYLKNFLSPYINLSNKDKIVLRNVVGAAVIKGFSFIISFISLPIYLRFFSDEKVLGIWFAVLSILIWVLSFDLGIGNGLRNRLVGAIQKEDKEQIERLIVNAYFLNGIISLIILSIGFWIIPTINWNKVLNISEIIISSNTLKYVVICAFLTIMVQFFLRIISFILYALQKSAVNNLLSFITSLSIVLVIIALPSSTNDSNLKIISVTYFFCVNIPLIIASIFVFKKEFRWLKFTPSKIQKKVIHSILHLGSIFFFNQILFAINININPFLVSHTSDPKNVVEYQIYYRLFSIIAIIISLSLTPLWSAITKAVEEHDYPWIKKYLKLSLKVIMLSLLFQTALLFSFQFIVDLWLKENAINGLLSFKVLFAIYGTVFISHNIYSTFACGFGKLKIQFYFYIFGLISKLLLVFLIPTIFTRWVDILIVDIVMLLFYSVVQRFSLFQHLEKLSKNM